MFGELFFFGDERVKYHSDYRAIISAIEVL